MSSWGPFASNAVRYIGAKDQPHVIVLQDFDDHVRMIHLHCAHPACQNSLEKNKKSQKFRTAGIREGHNTKFFVARRRFML